MVERQIQVDKIENPTVQDITTVHATYVEALKNLYDEYKPVYGNPKVKLAIT